MKRKLSRFPEIRARQKEQAQKETQTLLDQIKPQPTILDHLRQIDDMFDANGRITNRYPDRTMACTEWNDGQMLRVEVPDTPEVAPDEIARLYVERFRESLEHEMGLMDRVIQGRHPQASIVMNTSRGFTPPSSGRVTGPDRSMRHAAASEQLDSTLAHINAKVAEYRKEHRKDAFWSFAPLWVPVIVAIVAFVIIWLINGFGEN